MMFTPVSLPERFSFLFSRRLIFLRSSFVKLFSFELLGAGLVGDLFVVNVVGQFFAMCPGSPHVKQSLLGIDFLSAPDDNMPLGVFELLSFGVSIRACGGVFVGGELFPRFFPPRFPRLFGLEFPFWGVIVALV